jgi:hypothetical protein
MARLHSRSGAIRIADELIRNALEIQQKLNEIFSAVSLDGG